jgi:pimeloyl-ACP methyl ester carboxylesterase
MYSGFFFKIMRMGFHPTRENVERYIGWGSANEAPLPDSIIDQFTISVLNVNPNNAYPKMIRKQNLKLLKMPAMVLLGRNEFSFDIHKAESVAKVMINNLEIDIIEQASHLISVSVPNEINKKINMFLNDDK